LYVRGMNDTNDTWSGWAEVWTSSTDGAGSGLDADNLDGYTWASSGKQVRASDFYADNWFRNYNAGEGLYNEATGCHFASDGTDQWTVRDSGNSIRIEFKTNGTTRRASLYADNGSSIGFLNAANQWGLRYLSNDGNSPNLYFMEEANESWTGNPGNDVGKIEYHSNRFYIAAGANSTEICVFRRSGADRVRIDNSGNINLVSGYVNSPIGGRFARPSTLWTGEYYGITNLGGLYTEGSYRVTLSCNGYRNSSNQWTSYGANGNTGAATVGLDPSGQIFFGVESNKVNGSASGVTLLLTIKPDGLHNQSWYRAYGNNGYYFQTHGGGWNMTDTTWIRSYGNKSIYNNTGAIRTDGTLQVGSNGATMNVPNGGTPTINSNVIWHAGNDGPGTGLYADYSYRNLIFYSTNAAQVPVVGTDTVWSNNTADYTARLTRGPGQFSFNRNGGGVEIGGNLKAQGIYDSTNGTNALVRVNSDGLLRRDSSSRKYKTNIEDIQYSYTENFIDNSRPIWYQAYIPDPEYPQEYLDFLPEGKEPELEDCYNFVIGYNFQGGNIEWDYHSKCHNEGVNTDYGWWGFIAEELAEVDPRLVVFDENQEPIAINYDRSIPHIIMELKKKRQEVKDLQELVGNLVSRIEALESSNT